MPALLTLFERHVLYAHTHSIKGTHVTYSFFFTGKISPKKQKLKNEVILEALNCQKWGEKKLTKITRFLYLDFNV
jgi:hypothetical protein